MQNKLTVGIMSGLLVMGVGVIGWQGWNTHLLKQQVDEMQQQLAPTAPPSRQAPGSVQPVQPQAPQSLPPQRGFRSPFGNHDPFAEMQRMQEEMHQRMQQMMQGFGMNLPLFDMDPFRGGSGFSSSMGFGAQPDFSFSEEADHYVVTVKIPEGGNVEINTEVRGQELTIQGKVTMEENSQNGGGAFSSVQTQQFARTLTLPGDVDILGIYNETVGDEVRIKLPKKQGGSAL